MKSSPKTRHIASIIYWTLTVAVIWFTIQYWHHIPGTGKAIAVLGLAAVLMAIRGELMGHPEKVIWMLVVFALLYVELRSIDKDRTDNQNQQAAVRQQEAEHFKNILEENRNGIAAILNDQQAKFSQTMSAFSESARTEKKDFAQTLGGLKETINAATGGDGFCYIVLAPYDNEGTLHVNASVIPQGKYPLTNVNAAVTDDDLVLELLKRAGKAQPSDFGATMERAQEWIHIGDLPPQFTHLISMRTSAVGGDRHLLTIMFWANNGSWVEKYGLRRINGTWLSSTRIWRPRLDEKKRAIVYDSILSRVDKGFPEDANTTDPSTVSVIP